jgi:hypothetical protein
MMRHPWTFAATLFAFGIIGWVLVAERPQKGSVRQESFALSADRELRLISEHSPYMRTER